MPKHTACTPGTQNVARVRIDAPFKASPTSGDARLLLPRKGRYRHD